MINIEVTELYDKWFNKLKDYKAKDIINIRLDRIRAYENFGDYKALGNGLYEIRIHYGAGYRLYFVNKGRRWILILCGGDKSSQKNDLKRAKELVQEV